MLPHGTRRPLEAEAEAKLAGVRFVLRFLRELQFTRQANGAGRGRVARFRRLGGRPIYSYAIIQMNMAWLGLGPWGEWEGPIPQWLA